MGNDEREQYHLTFKRSLIEEVNEEFDEHKTINGSVESAMKDGLIRRKNGKNCITVDSDPSEVGKFMYQHMVQKFAELEGRVNPMDSQEGNG